MTAITNRKLDELGRIVLPMEIRTSFGLKEGDSLAVCVEDGQIILLPNQPRCALCKTTENLTGINSRYICAGCKEKIK